MAGSPQRKLRDLQAKLAAAGIDPETLQPIAPQAAPAPVAASGGDGEVRSLRGGSTRAHASAHAREAPDAPRAQVGQRTRGAVDARMATDVDQLALVLQPNLIARIERTRPTWAAGFVEDHLLEADGMTDLLAYIRDEHGGQSYKVTLLAPDGRTVLYVAKVPIAGLPRRRGRETTRARWDGEEEQARSSLREAVTTPERSNNMGDVAALVKALGDAMGGGNAREDRVLEGMRDMFDRSQSQTIEILKTMVAQRQQSPGGDLIGQIQQVAKAKGALSRLREALVDDEEPRGGGGGESERGLVDELGKQILTAAVQNEMQMRSQRAQQPQQPATSRVRRGPLRSVTPSGNSQS